MDTQDNTSEQDRVQGSSSGWGGGSGVRAVRGANTPVRGEEEGRGETRGEDAVVQSLL